MSGGISSRTYYTKLNFYFSYVRFLSLRRDPYIQCTECSVTVNHYYKFSTACNDINRKYNTQTEYSFTISGFHYQKYH